MSCHRGNELRENAAEKKQQQQKKTTCTIILKMLSLAL